MSIIVNLDVMLAKRKMSLSELSESAGMPARRYTRIPEMI